MSNGFRYESPINRLLSVTIPRFLDNQLEREHRERISEREFTYRSTQDQLDRTREQERLKLEADRYDKEWIEKEDDEQRLSSASIFEDIRISYPNIRDQLGAISAIDASKLHPDVQLRVTSHEEALTKEVEDIANTMKQFGSEKLWTDLERKRIEASFMQRKDGYKTADDIIRNKFSTDYIKVRASNISKQLGVLYEDRSKAQQLLSITTDKDQQKIIQSNIDDLQRQINTEEGKIDDLYGQDRPFDPTDYSKSFSIDLKSSLKKAGIKVDDADLYAKIVGAKGRYSTELQAFNEKYITGINAKEHTKEERDAAALQIKNLIIEGEKTRPPEPEPEYDWSNINRLDPEGTALLAVGGGALLYKPTKAAFDYLSTKGAQAVKHLQFVTKLPGQDLVKFLDQVGLDTPGKPGTMMPKVESLLDEINELSGEKKTKKNIVKMQKLNAELDSQVNKVKTRLKKLGVSSKMKDSDLEKLLRNPNKWRLAKLKGLFSRAYPKLKSGATKWGVLSASAKIGQLIGDPTGGIVTAVGTGSAIKGIKSIYKKKGPKWLMAKLAPVVGKSIAKRIVGGAVAGAKGGPWVAAGGAIAGTGLAIYDIYQFLESLSEGASEEEAVTVLQNAVQRDSTQAQIDSARVADSTNWMLPAGPAIK